MIKNQLKYDESLWSHRDSKRLERREPKLKRDAKQTRLPTGPSATITDESIRPEVLFLKSPLPAPHKTAEIL